MRLGLGHLHHRAPPNRDPRMEIKPSLDMAANQFPRKVTEPRSLPLRPVVDQFLAMHGHQSTWGHYPIQFPAEMLVVFVKVFIVCIVSHVPLRLRIDIEPGKRWRVDGKSYRI